MYTICIIIFTLSILVGLYCEYEIVQMLKKNYQDTWQNYMHFFNHRLSFKKLKSGIKNGTITTAKIIGLKRAYLIAVLIALISFTVGFFIKQSFI